MCNKRNDFRNTNDQIKNQYFLNILSLYKTIQSEAISRYNLYICNLYLQYISIEFNVRLYVNA